MMRHKTVSEIKKRYIAIQCSLRGLIHDYSLGGATVQSTM